MPVQLFSFSSGRKTTLIYCKTLPKSNPIKHVSHPASQTCSIGRYVWLLIGLRGQNVLMISAHSIILYYDKVYEHSIAVFYQTSPISTNKQGSKLATSNAVIDNSCAAASLPVTCPAIRHPVVFSGSSCQVCAAAAYISHSCEVCCPQ